MRRTLSSPLTVLWKFVYPTLLIVAFLGVIGAACLGYLKKRDGARSRPEEIALGIVCFTAVAASLIWWASSLKRVEVDDQALYVSNYRNAVRIPLSEVSNVTEGWSRKYFTLAIHLRHPCIFGERIVFRPKLRLYWRGLHPIARELKALADQAKAGEAVPNE